MRYFIYILSFIFVSIAHGSYAATNTTHHNIHKKTIQHTQNKAHTKKKRAQPSSQAIININTANIKQLATVKGIGVKRAATIIQYRKQHGIFKDINDLTAIRGISQTQVNKIKNNITVSTKNTHR